MKAAGGLLVCWLVLGAAVARAEEAADASGASVLVAAPGGSVSIQVALRVDDVPTSVLWDRYASRLFELLDRDGDGRLAGEEWNSIPRPAMLRTIWRGDFDNLRADFATAAELDQEPRQSQGEPPAWLAAWYRRMGVTRPELQRAFAPTLDDAACRWLFDMLRGPDDALRPESLLTASQRLRAADPDDDERWFLVELKHAAETHPVSPPSPASRLALPGTEPPTGKLVIWRLALALSTRADGAQGFEIGSQLLPPELTLAGQRGEGRATQVLAAGLGAEWRLEARAGRGGERFESGRQLLVQEFETADVDHDRALSAQEIKPSPLAETWSTLLTLADGNRDQRLTDKELARFLDAQALAAGWQVTITDTYRGRPLAERLDANEDGKLSLRELRHGWTRLARWDSNHDGQLAWDELPRQFELSWSLGPPVKASLEAEPGSSKSAASHWFRNMDRNGDGDVSPREFLGPLETFEQFDSDHDGLISPAEAERGR